MSTILIRGGHLLDPATGTDRPGDLLLRDGRVAGFDPGTVRADETVEARGCYVCPGFVDLHVSFREPGFEEDETMATGTAAAVAGGFTTVACMPDTNPVVDNRAAAEFVILQAERAGHCHVLPLGAVTKNHEGVELAEIGQLVDGGAVAFSGANRAVANAEILRRALEYARMFSCPVFDRPQVPELVEGGVMHEGVWSVRLGLKGMPAAAEEIMTARDIALAELSGGRIHLMCLSTRQAVDLVRRAKARGLRITCDVAPHQLALTDAALRDFDPNCKVSPPLRTQEHIDALVAGLQDGTIDAICSDHQPHADEKKAGELDQVPFGIVGLETLLPLCVRTLIEPGHLSWLRLVEKLALHPARILGIPKGTISPGADADVTIVDPHREWTVDPQAFKSKSANTPFGGWRVRGRVRQVFVRGRLRYADA